MMEGHAVARPSAPAVEVEPEAVIRDTGMVRLTCCQLSPVIGDLSHNRALTVEAIDAARQAGSHLIVLPELVTSGYCFASADEARRSAITRSDPIFDDWKRAAGTSIVIAGFAEVADSILYNSAVVLDPSGATTWYRKTHLWDAEKTIFTPGNQPPPLIETRIGRVGLLVCYDLEFPELTRSLALAGADLLAVPANWPLLEPVPSGEHPSEVMIAMATARMNHLFVACCDRGGTERGQQWTEASAIVSANGWLLARAEAGFTSISADLDLKSARDKSVSRRNDLFADRRERIYQQHQKYDRRSDQRVDDVTECGSAHTKRDRREVVTELSTFNETDAERRVHGSDGARFGSLIYISGQAPLDESGAVLYPRDVAAQTRHVIRKIAQIATIQGASLSDVISVSVFLQNREDFSAFDFAYAAEFGDHRPTRTTVRADLIVDGMLVEASAILVRDNA